MGLIDKVKKPNLLDGKRYAYIMGKCKEFYELGMTAVDVGTSDGAFAIGLKKIGYKVTTIGLNECEISKSHYTIDIQKEKIDKKFDLILFCEIAEHLKFPDKGLNNTLLMAKNNSLVFVSVPNFMCKAHLRTYSMAGLLSYVDKKIKIKGKTTFTKKYKGKPKSEQYLIYGTKI